MNFSCERNTLTEAISAAGRAVASRGAHAILEGLYLKASDNSLILTGYDLEIGIEVKIDAEVSQYGEAVVSAKLFSDIIRKATGDKVNFAVEGNSGAVIKCGRSKFKINVMNAEDYIHIPLHDAENAEILKLTQKQFKDLVKATVFAVSTNEAKMILTGCLLEIEGNKVSMVAIDGFRLALKQLTLEDCGKETKIVIPAKTLNELIKVLRDSDEPIEIAFTEKNVIFRFNNCTFTSRLLEGEFIDYRKIIPAFYKTTVVTPIRPLIEAVERVALIITSEVNKNPIVVNMTNDSLIIKCETAAGVAEESLPVDITGEPFTIGFNSRYLIDALRSVDEEKVQLNFIGQVNPCLILPINGDDFKYIILPVRL